jgi:hypothetical protein
LFRHLSLANLPGIEHYWDAAVDTCGVYKTKQAQIQGDTVLAHVYCHSAGTDGRSDSHITVFSRTMLIDISDPDNPGYFDLTGWFEDNFDNWEQGKATGFTVVLKRL